MTIQPILRTSFAFTVWFGVTACGGGGNNSGTDATTGTSTESPTTGGGPSTSVTTVVSTGTPTTDAASTGSGTGDASTGDVSTGVASTGSGSTGPGSDCGNDMIEGDEECDGADLAGKACMDIDAAYVSGTLVCGLSCTFDTSGCMVKPGEALVVLNELTSESVAAGTYAGALDAIELYNAGDAAADLSGWKLSDDPMFMVAKTYVFPGASMLGPGEYKVLVAKDPLTMIGDFPFGISDNTVETITLADAQGVTIDSVVSDGYKSKVSYCRIPDGLGAWAQCDQTFGAKNQLAATACGNGKLEAPESCDGAQLGGKDCKNLGLGYSGGTLACNPKCNFDTTKCTTNSLLVINELESTVDNIEIFNGGNATVDLSGWILTDDKVDLLYTPAMDLAELQFPANTSIVAGAYLVIPIGMGPLQHPFGLGSMGDTVTLVKPDLTIIDQVTYGPGQATMSYCRKPSGPGGTWTANCIPTIGFPN